MARTIEFGASAKKDPARLDPTVARRIVAFLRDRVATADDPRALGSPLRGSRLSEFWRYRVGDYRLIVTIEDDVLRVLVVKIGHRRDVYT